MGWETGPQGPSMAVACEHTHTRVFIWMCMPACVHAPCSMCAHVCVCTWIASRGWVREAPLETGLPGGLAVSPAHRVPPLHTPVARLPPGNSPWPLPCPEAHLCTGDTVSRGSVQGLCGGGRIQPGPAFPGSEERLSAPEIATQMMLLAAGDEQNARYPVGTIRLNGNYLRSC